MIGMREDTIAAIATPPGTGGIGIIRLSGARAEEILRAVFIPAGGWRHPPESHRMIYGHVYDGEEIVDEGMAVLMRAPRSYTRENVAELQLHGGGYVLHRALELCLLQGARLAEAGEFTRRAFENGRVDLSRAEAVMSLISARGEQEHRAAVRDLEGGVTAFARRAADELYAIQAGLAACIDYPEEISEEEGAADLLPRLRKLIGELKGALDERGSRLLQDGLRVALAGRPNVGKSSLLNALLGEEKAIVTDIPGTTRDMIQGEMTLGGVRVILTDTAGLRDTADPVERIGVERSRQAMREADLVLLLLDGNRPVDAEERERAEALREQDAVVISKSDLPPVVKPEDIGAMVPGVRCFLCSAREEESLRPLKDYLRGHAEISDRMTVTRPRQADAVRRAVTALESALETAENLTPDMASTDLQTAQEALSELTGDRADEKLLDAVFSQFCVGK